MAKGHSSLAPCDESCFCDSRLAVCPPTGVLDFIPTHSHSSAAAPCNGGCGLPDFEAKSSACRTASVCRQCAAGGSPVRWRPPIGGSAFSLQGGIAVLPPLVPCRTATYCFSPPHPSFHRDTLVQVQKGGVKEYVPIAVLTPSQAYQNARLVSQPHCDWLHEAVTSSAPSLGRSFHLCASVFAPCAA